MTDEKLFDTAQWEPVEVNESEVFNDQQTDFNTPPPPPPTNGQQQQAPGTTTINIGQQIPAAFAVEMIDKIGCALGVAIGEMAGVKISKRQIALDKSEKDFIEPAMEGYLKTVNITLTPGEALLAAIGTVYVSKVVTIVSTAEVEKKPQGMNANNVGNQPQRTRKVRSDKGIKKS